MTALLDARGICAWYGEAQVLRGVDLRIDAGELVLLCGRNGSGRSTFAKALAGLVDRSGSIAFAGEEVIGRPTYEIARRGMGYVAEQREVFPTLSVEENLRLGLPPGLRRAAARWRIDESLARFPMLAPRRATAAGVLSGGEQQMLVLARALMREPRLLIADEPTEGLAPQAAADVSACLRGVCERGGAVLLIEQRLTLAQRLAERVAVMGHGRIVFDGAVNALDAQIVDDWLALGGED
jgi:branched-chain amino acid transport system ATP-binding protein